MSKEIHSADLIMRLYDLRRESTMRAARDWFVTFFPESFQDVMHAMVDPKLSAYYRMCLSYWDMAASFVVHGAIDEAMFMETNGESMMVFAKIEPFLDEIRANFNNPNYLKNLESLALKLPDGKDGMAARRDMLKRMLKARADLAASSQTA